MRLTSYSNYALRAMQLAALKAPALVRVDDVVTVHGLARPHIVKIVHELGKAGLIETQRGRGGGFRLARAPEAITVGEVVRLTEGPIELVECFNDDDQYLPAHRHLQAVDRLCPGHARLSRGARRGDHRRHRVQPRSAPRPDRAAAGPRPSRLSARSQLNRAVHDRIPCDR